MWSTNFGNIPQPSLNIQNWLLKPYVLSAALKRVSDSVKVKVLQQCFEPAFEDEKAHLNLSETPFVRQVFLSANNKAMTYGRVIIPHATYNQFLSDFENLGAQFIGEKLLYNQHTTRGNFEYAFLDKTQALTQNIFQHLTTEPAQGIWARRSLFYLQSYPLLVTDVILPWIATYVDAPD